MRSLRTVVLSVGLAILTAARVAAQDAHPAAVVIHVSNAAGVSANVMTVASARVSHIFREMGVDVEWSATSTPAPIPADSPDAVHVAIDLVSRAATDVDARM